MKKSITIIATLVVILLVISAFNHINIRTTRLINRYWQEETGIVYYTYKIRESKLLTGETIRTDFFVNEQFCEAKEFLEEPDFEKETVSMYFY